MPFHAYILILQSNERGNVVPIVAAILINQTWPTKWFVGSQTFFWPPTGTEAVVSLAKEDGASTSGEWLGL